MAIDNKEDRKTAIEMFLRFVQAAPESFPPRMGGEAFARMIIEGSEKLGEYVINGKRED